MGRRTEDFLKKVDALRKEKHSVVVAVSEGLKNQEGNYICEESLKDAPEDAFGHKILTGTATYLTRQIQQQLGIKARDIILNTLQRCASHMVSRRDITEAFMAGADAIRAAIKGHSGEMVVFRRVSNEPYHIMTETHDIYKIANAVKYVPQDWITPDGSNVTDAFSEYAKPLIIGELDPFMVNGLPHHLVLK